MSYYFSKKLHSDFPHAVERVTDALKQNGFGIVTEIDVKNTFEKKLGVGFRNYRILGACNPAMAREALLIEDKIGTMLPCNVVVQELPDGRSRSQRSIRSRRWRRSTIRSSSRWPTKSATCCARSSASL